MSHASLKEQLQALASQLPGNAAKSQAPSESKPKSSNKAHKPRPANHKPKAAPTPKPKWLEHAQYGVELLKTYFPGCFKSPNEVKPLKKGIKQDLVKKLTMLTDVVTDDKACMVKSLTYYVNTLSYHKSVIQGTARVDLEGQPAGIVTADEANYSAERCQSKMKKRQSSSTVKETAAAPQPLETEIA